MHEIEVKARIKDKEAIIKALTIRGVELSEPIMQRDVIYITGTWSDFQQNPNRNTLRIRYEANCALFTLKRNGSNELDSLEKETEVSSPDQLHEILGFLGYAPFLEMVKQRQKGKLDDMGICLDEVEGLGTFIEVEKFSDDAETVQENLFQFLENLGITQDQRVTQGYDTLVRVKKLDKS